MCAAPVAVFDGHNDTLLKLELAARHGQPADFAAGCPVADIDLPRARAAGFAGGLFAMFTPGLIEAPGHEAAPDDPREFAPVDQPGALAFTLALFARLRRLVRALPGDLALCTTPCEVRQAMAAGRIAAVAHIEGAECIDTDLDALEVLHGAGLRSLGPVWSRPNAFGHGAPMAAQPRLDPGQGLTDAGRALVRGAESLGILIDCAHLTETGFWDVAAVSERPLVVSHSNAHALSPNARNLTDRQLDAVAERGGLVGLNFHTAFLRADCAREPDTPVEAMLRHIDHLLSRLGEGGVALGSDFDGCTLPAIIGDVTGLPRLIAAMREAGYGEALIARIARENWLDMLARGLAR